MLAVGVERGREEVLVAVLQNVNQLKFARSELVCCFIKVFLNVESTVLSFPSAQARALTKYFAGLD